MAASVFYSFYYDDDVLRVQLVEQIGSIEGQQILEAQEWESIEAQGSAAVRKWIDSKMSGVDAVIVLIGSKTATRPWVKYEIEKAWADGIPLLGIRIHGISAMGSVASEGPNPFDAADVPAGIPVFDPTQRDSSGRIDSRATYNYLAANLESWSRRGKTA